jgi:hypothetical protein
MARLTLDENGAKRRFKLNPGKLTIGGGDGATLKLASNNVADLHAELVFEAGVARLRPRPGVLPPTIGGKAVTTETVLAGGQVVKIGTATISVEYDEGEGPKGTRPAPAAAGATKAAVRPATAPVRTKASGAVAPAATRNAAADERPEIRYQRREVKQGVPTWAILSMFAVGILLAFLFAGDFWSSATSGGFNPSGARTRFDSFWGDGDTKGAALVLEEFEGAELNAEWKAEYERMRALVDSTRSKSAKGLVDMEATKEWQNQLEMYFKTHLEGKATRPKARVFVKRLQSFRERFPDHEQREWVDRMLTRFSPVAELHDPSTLADVQWEVNRFTIAKPRRYKEAFKAIDEFLERATGTDRDEALKLKAATEAEQKKLFDEELLGAAVYYDREKYPNKFDPMKSIEILVQLVIGMADPELADDAARRLVSMEEITVLEGYKRERSVTFERLMENAIVRERAKQLGLVD